MKKSIILFAAAAIVCACSYEPIVKTGEPSVTFDAESFSGYPGQTITVTGTAADPAGLSAINLQVQDWDFQKKTDFSKGAPASYSFSADVVIPESASGSATFTATAVSAVSGVATESINIIITAKPEPVVDTQTPVITMESAETAEAGVPYTFVLTFSDDVGIIECWPKWHINMGWTTYPTVDGEAYNTNGYSVTVSGQSTKVSYTLVFPSAGEYDVIVYDSIEGVSDGIHTMERADDWSIAKFKITVTGEDTQAPVITLLSAETATVGEDYVLSFKVEDETALEAGDVSITVWGNFDPWPKPLDGAVLSIGEGVKEAVFTSDAFVFTTAGEYKVWIGPVSDGTNQAANADVFVINVQEGAVTPDPVKYLTLDQLPTSLSLKLEDGLATYTLYMKGERTDETNYTGVEFDLYDSAWTKLVPYGCTNTWDWGEWGMYGTPSYQLDKVISFDTAGFYYLYIGEKWGNDGYAGHQIDITITE